MKSLPNGGEEEGVVFTPFPVRKQRHQDTGEDMFLGGWGRRRRGGGNRWVGERVCVCGGGGYIGSGGQGMHQGGRMGGGCRPQRHFDTLPSQPLSFPPERPALAPSLPLSLPLASASLLVPALAPLLAPLLAPRSSLLAARCWAGTYRWRFRYPTYRCVTLGGLREWVWRCGWCGVGRWVMQCASTDHARARAALIIPG